MIRRYSTLKKNRCPIISLGLITWALSVIFTAVSAAEELKDVKAPVGLPRPYLTFIIVAIALVLAGIVFYFLKKYLKSKSEDRLVVIVPPWEKAYQALNDLAESGLLDNGEFKAYYIRLSEIIRHYLEGRFNLRAPEMTTEEFLLHMKDASHLKNDQKDVLKEFLQMSDFVKFAKHIPTMDESQRHFKVAQTLIDQTKIKEVNVTS